MIIVKRVLAIIVILALFASGVTFFTKSRVATAQDAEYESFTPELAEQLTEISQQKEALTPTQRKIDSNILRVVRQIGERVVATPFGATSGLADISTTMVKVSDAGEIEVKLTVARMTDCQLEQLKALGMQIEITLPKYGVIEGSLSYNQVEAVAGLDFVLSVGMPGYALHNTGDVNSEGDAVLRATEARTAFGVDGSGLKVGVMSDGVTHLANSQASGDLPSVDVLNAGSGDEGTAMLEIIHDLAPGAELAFYSPSSSSDMVVGIGALETADCDIIVDDLTYFDEPKFEDGPIVQEARQFVTNGGVYVTSAGNHAQDHYRATYSPDGVVYGDYSSAHDYGSGDIGNTFSVPNGGEIVAILQWNNQWGSSGDDFDLFLARSSDDYVLNTSKEWQTGTGNPWEGLAWINDTGSSVTVYIAVLEYDLVNSPSSLILDYYVYYDHSGLEYITPSNSVIGHAAVEEVLSTAAANAATPDTIEYFSSRGPGTIYFPTYEDRQVPNIAGVDGVHTKTGQLGHFYDPFYGTSAAAPHVAAIATLVWEANPTLTSGEVRSAITSTAVDLGLVGWDAAWGWGRVDAYNAVESVIGAASITVTSPNGGENWNIGSTQTITWTSSGVTGNVHIGISRDGGSSWSDFITNTPNDGSETWTVTGPATTQARMKVTSASDGSIWDMSDSNFIISPTGAPPQIEWLLWDGQTIATYHYAGGVLIEIRTYAYFENIGGPGTVDFEPRIVRSYDGNIMANTTGTFDVESGQDYCLTIPVYPVGSDAIGVMYDVYVTSPSASSDLHRGGGMEDYWRRAHFGEMSLEIYAVSNTPPEVTNVTASQGSPIVDISYDVSDAEQSDVTINFEYWDGSSWQACTTTTGEGTQSTGTGKSGTWDAKADFDEHYMTNCKIKVTADDGQAENNTGTGESSTFILDTKDPTGYGCISPTNGATNVSVDPNLTCFSASDDSLPVSYYFQLAEDDAFSVGLQESGWQSSTTWSPSTLDYDKQYFWRAKAKDNYDNESGYSSTFDFNTESVPNTPPDTPSNPSPANHTASIPINADLSWSGGDPDTGDTVTYDVYFGTSVSPPLVSNNQLGTTYDPGTLAYNTTYYWKVIATDNHGVSTPGPLWDFTTRPETEMVTVSIDALDEVAEGCDFVANVTVDWVTDFNSCGFDVTYNETIITVTDVTGGEIDDHAVEVDDWFYIPPDTVDTGRIRVIAGVPGAPAPGVTGTGYIAQIHFHVLGSVCQTSAIHLEGVGMYDYLANRIDTTTVDDSVHVAFVSPEITTATLPDGEVGDAYSATLEATDGVTPYTWEATGLPAGLTCSTAGVISGTPVGEVGSFNVTVTVTDALTTTDTKELTLTISCKLGDANMDGVVDTGDITKVKRIYFGLDDPTPCADVNGDGVIDTGDITKIKRIYFGID